MRRTSVVAGTCLLGCLMAAALATVAALATIGPNERLTARHIAVNRSRSTSSSR